MALPKRQIFEGKRVLEVGPIPVGTLTGAFLADFGADVIRVAKPNSDDPMDAWWGGPYTKNGISLVHKVQGRNKRNITLDLSKPQGRDLFHKLVAVSDVVLETLRPGVMERWGNDWETLQSINPGLIFCRLSGFGQTGPYSHRRADGRIAEAFGGYSWLAGDADGPPLHSQMDMGGCVAGIWTAMGIAMALYWRDVQGGKGQVIDIGLYETMSRQLGNIAGYAHTGSVNTRFGNRKSGGFPWVDSHKTKDGKYFTYSAATRPTMRDQMLAMGMFVDPRFKDLPTTFQNRDDYHDATAQWMSEHTIAEVDEAFKAYECASTPVMNAEDLCDDPHIKAREDVITVDDPDLGPVRMQGIIPKFEKTPGEVRHAGEALNARNTEVYGELLGLSPKELEALGAAGVV